jgi:hypothetical protein
MDDPDPSPFVRHMGAFRNADLGVDDPPASSVTRMPWIDIHQHGHTLSWGDRERFDLSGAEAAVFVAAAAHYAPYRPMRPEDVRFLWDDAIRRAHAIGRSHFFDPYVAIGIHTTGPKVDYEDLFDVLPKYAALDEVVALGETGISMTQYSEPMALTDQEAVVREQMRVADDQGLPILIHTPSITKAEGEKWLTGKTEEGHDLADPVLDPATAKLDATEMDVAIMDEVGLADEQVVLDHAHPSMVEFVMESTDCYLAFSIGQWIRTTTVEDVAAVIEEYGPERIILDTDVAGMYRTQPFAMKRAILDLVREGVAEDDVRQVVYENPKGVLGLE